MQEERITQLITVPEWKSILLDLVEKNEIDPWDVDIVRLTELYLEEIQKLRGLDLYIPANAVLAASILLYLKSRVLKELREELERQEEEEVEPIDMVLPEPEEVLVPEAGEVLPPPRVVPPSRLVKRGVTLEELLDVMEKLMKKRPRKKPVEPLPEVEDFFERFEEEDVESFVEEVYEKVLSLKDSTDMVTLSAIAPKDPLSFVKTFLALLYLANEGRVELFQEEVFGEVIVRVVG